MCAMFGLGRHPSDRANIRRIPRDGASHRVQDAATKLGHAYHFYEQSEFHAALAARYPRAQFRSQCPRRRGYPGHRAGRTEGFDLVRATQDLSGFGLPGTPLLGLRPRFVLRVPRRERRLLRQLDRRRWATVLVLEAPGQGCEFRLDVAPARQPGAQQLGWESGDLADLAPAVARVGTLGEPHPDPFGQQGLDAGVVVLGSGVSTWRRRRCRVGCRRRASPAMRSCRLQPAARASLVCSRRRRGRRYRPTGPVWFPRRGCRASVDRTRQVRMAGTCSPGRRSRRFWCAAIPPERRIRSRRQQMIALVAFRAETSLSDRHDISPPR